MIRQISALLTCVACFAAVFVVRASHATDVEAKIPAIAITPVEASMHEFMEYMYQPAFLRLKASMAAAPSDNMGWKAIKTDSLILAEANNLLLERGPQEDSADWKAHAVRVREAGAELYGAAKAKEYDASHAAFLKMLERCNACHKQFAEGKHQLSP